VDHLATRILEGLMAFPAIRLAIALASALGFGARNEVIALARVYVPRTGRIDARILGVHIFRNALPPPIVQSTFVFAETILADPALLGLGVKPPTPTVGEHAG
jgi:peptide/nickel transport system permease protein